MLLCAAGRAAAATADASSRITCEIMANIAATALEDARLTPIGSGPVEGSIPFYIAANSDRIDIGIFASSLYKASDPRSAFRITLDQAVPASLQVVGGSPVPTLLEWVAPCDVLGYAGAMTSLGRLESGLACAFSDQVRVNVAWRNDDPALPMSTLIYKIRRPEEIDDPNHVKTVFDRDFNALYFSRSPIPFQRNPEEQAKPTYYKHLGFYAYRKGFLLSFVALPEGEWERFEKLEQLRALEYGYKIKLVVTEHDSIEVDTPEELARVERFLAGGR